MKNALLTELSESDTGASRHFNRRNFLGLTGGLFAAGLLLDSCKKDDDDPDNGVNLGSGDVGILNYAYALEQLEAAFYTKVAQSPYAGITATESALLTDIRDHEVAHREFFKAALAGNAIGALEVDFSSINFGSRDSVLATAKTWAYLHTMAQASS